MKPTPLFPPRTAPADRLESWKEIAVYLGRDQRTLQRWEHTEGLPVHRLQHGKAGSVFALRTELEDWLARRSTQPSSARAHRRDRLLGRGALLIVTALVAAGGWLLLRNAPQPRSATPATLASEPGTRLEARLSPDGAQVAYVWNGEAEDNFDIYVRSVAGGAPARLTANPAQDYSPAWSPDGALIAFLRRTGPAAATVFVAPALGGPERKVAEIGASEWSPWSRPGPFLDWSRSGKWLVTAGFAPGSQRDVLLRVSLADGSILPLTSVPANVMGDMAPAFSPDGRKLAFSRMLSWGRSELRILPVSPDARAAGEPRKLETGSTWNASPAWLPDGRGLVASAGSMDAPRLTRIEASGSGPARQLADLVDYGWSPSLARSRAGRIRLVYTQHYESVNIWRTDLGGGAPVKLIASAHWSYEPAWSPDATRIAFLSDRTGHGEIWVADADGRNPRQWTFLKQPRLGAPRWSPDGRRIAFSAPGARGSSIYLLEGPGSPPRLVPGTEECGYLDWGHDGRSIYFSSRRDSRVEIWKISPEGGTAERVTDAGGRVPSVSSDGRYIYYLRMTSADGRNDLFRKSAGGQEERVLEFVDAYSLADTGIAYKYYRPGPTPVGPYLEFLRFSDRGAARLADPPRPLRYGIALSRDARMLLHAQVDYEVSDLMSVDDFR